MSRIKNIPTLFILAALITSSMLLLPGCGKDDFVMPPGDPQQNKVMVIAFDGLDPKLVQQWMDEGLLPNFSKLAKQGGFMPLGTSIPPQSPVAWSNFITGQNPGGHGIFDFIHRDPETYLPFLSTSKTETPQNLWKIGRYQIPMDSGSVKLMRKGRAFWEYLGDAGIPSTIFSIPSNYPPVEGPFRSLAGMGTPDLLGGYGSFSYFTDDPPQPKPGEEITGGKVYPVEVVDNQVDTALIGPKNTFIEVPENKSPPDSTVPFVVHVDPENDAVTIDIMNRRILLNVGEWSEWTQVEFEMVPILISVKGMVRFLLKGVRPFKLYVSPINIDPTDPALPISTPPEYAAQLAQARGGPFHTQGIPEDTKGLSGDILTNEEFLQQANTVLSERLSLYDFELSRFNRGFLFFYFSSSDQISHMFWRTMDPTHPAYVAEKDGAFQEVLKQTYIHMDKALAKAMDKVDDKTVLIVMSDHGFAPYNKSFHLSSWLLDNGYVILQNPMDRDADFLMNVQWMGTQAYALGINGVYLNMAGRERMGIVQPTQADALLDEISAKLLEVVDPETGENVVASVYKTSQAYIGPNKAGAPDLIIGFNRGYRASWETALGKFPEGNWLNPNLDEWSGDHCMAAELVPGVLFTNQPLQLKYPKLYDLPVTVLELFGLPRPKDMIGRNVFTGK